MAHALRVLVVFAHLGGPEERQVRALARQADPGRFRLDVLVCFGDVAYADAASRTFADVGVRVDTTPFTLSLDDTSAYLADLLPGYDVVVSCQDPPDLEPALAALAVRPPVVDLGLLVRPGTFGESGEVGKSGEFGNSGDPVAPSAWMLAAAAERGRPRRSPESALASEWLGGFECSTHRRHHDRRRVDVIAATRHDELARIDYARLAGLGLRTVRDGVRWHLVEADAGQYSFGSLAEQLDAAAATGVQVIWDLLHYGWPDHLDLWGPDFPDRFAAYCGAVATHLAARLPGPRWYAPVNEISFLAWAGGDVGYLNPFATGRGIELKVQLVRATMLAQARIRAIDPTARFVHPEPLIHVVHRRGHPEEAGAAEVARRSQYQAWDMLAGRAWPQLRGRPELLDVIGVNYYPVNQWEHHGDVLEPGDPRRRPLADLLAGVHARYGRPLVVTETGTEGDDRAAWLDHVDAEVDRARRRGVPVWGVCLYPVLDHPGWDDDRYCPNGLLTWDPRSSARGVVPALAEALAATRRPPGEEPT